MTHMLDASMEILTDKPSLALYEPDFQIPSELEATGPAEERSGKGGVKPSRDKVRLMVTHHLDDVTEHTWFSRIPGYLDPGDVLAINTSPTMKAALDAHRADGSPLELRLSTRLPSDLWILELRLPREKGGETFYEGMAGELLRLPGGGCARLVTPYDPSLRRSAPDSWNKVRLWLATLELPAFLEDYLEANGFPIRYAYVALPWPIETYQTVYASKPQDSANFWGSAEMPSAGRAFTPEIITRLVAKGVQVLPLTLHTGVSSPEAGELPHEEYYSIPQATADGVNQARVRGNKVITVGTTAVRALETVADERGAVYPGEGWTRLVIRPERGLRVVDGMLTGFHEPGASHISMLVALAGEDHIALAYSEALEKEYLWHEFGDLHLLLP